MIERTYFPACCGAEILSRFGFCMSQGWRPGNDAQARALGRVVNQWGRPVQVAILTQNQARNWKDQLETYNFKRVTTWMRGSHTTKFAVFVRHQNPRVNPQRRSTDDE
jgi:hypothetical protein